MPLLLVITLLSNPPPLEISGSLAQIEKHALRISVLAEQISETAETSAQKGRPYGLAMMESDLASIEIHLKRLNSALTELEKTIEAAP